jgi:hypothetical protein
MIIDAGAENTQEKETEIQVYESAGNGGLDEVAFAVTGFADSQGTALGLPTLSTRIFGKTLTDSTDFSVNAGSGKVFVPKFTLPANLAAGSYTLGLKITVNGSGLNANLDSILPADQQGTPWTKTGDGML